MKVHLLELPKTCLPNNSHISLKTIVIVTYIEEEGNQTKKRLHLYQENILITKYCIIQIFEVQLMCNMILKNYCRQY